MFEKTPDERLSEWAQFRKELEHQDNPFELVSQFWANVTVIPYNHKVDPYNPKSWPTPWEIIVENKYDDFTLALMMAYTLKFTNRYKNDLIQVRIMVDYPKTKLYNLVFINNTDVLNYNKEFAVNSNNLDESLYLENTIDVIFPR